MKLNHLLTLCAIFIATSMTVAQDAASLVKEASKSLSAYNLDPTNKADKLTQAATAIEAAFESGDLSKDYKALLTKAQILSALASKDYQAALLASDYRPQYADKAVEAVSAAAMALGLAEKKYQTKEVLSVIGEVAPYLSVIGNQFINIQDLAAAYKPLNSVLAANKMLQENNEDSIFANDDDLDNHKYVTAVCALESGDNARAEALLTELYNSDAKELGIYSTLFNLKINEDPEMAMKVLEKGRQIDPESKELLFAEINYYISQEEYEKLESKLQMAIDKDPENASVRAALGNVYMNLSEASAKEGNEAKAKEYFDKSLDFYQQTLELDPNSFEANYSIGSLYYNKAAEKTQIMFDLTMSKEDQMKYAELEKETSELFAIALDYFKQAEILNPNDINTIIALKEIHVRLNDIETSNIFKERLEKIQSGGQITESYFKGM